MARAFVSEQFNIYYISCESAGMGYVGVTNHDIVRRFKRHLWNAKKGQAGLLYEAVRQYGAQAFSVERIETVISWETACERECFFIKAFETKNPGGFNMTDGGESNYGYVYPNDVRVRLNAAISAANTGRVATEEERAARSEARKGIAPVAMIQSNIGRTHSPEWRANQSAGGTDVKRTDETRANMKAAAIKRTARLAAEGRPYTPPSWEGKTHSEETRARMSATNKARWALRKAKEAAASAKLAAA